MKTLGAILVTILVMLQLFYYAMTNAKSYFGYNVQGEQVVCIETIFGTYNYWGV